MVQTDANGIQWLLATGEQGMQDQTRFDAGDYRWSCNVDQAKSGWEVTAIFTFTGVNSSGTFELKHNGPNHSAPCGYEESNECCCWYDTGIVENGDVDCDVERSHGEPNYQWTSAQLALLLMTNIGQVMDGNTIGLKWIWYPLIQNGNAHNGGIRIKMYKNTSALTNGVPNNQWVLVYDIIDNHTVDILDESAWIDSGHPPYDSPEEQELEIRVHGTDDVECYGGGMHYRRILPADVYGGGQGCPQGTHYNNATGQCVPDDTSCPAGQHWDWTVMQCVNDAIPPPPPPAGDTKVTDLKLYLSGGDTNQNAKTSLGGHISTTEFIGTKAHQILDMVTTQEMQSSMTDYHMLYIKNTNQLYTYNNIRIFVYHNTVNPYDSILIGLASVGKNYDEFPLLVDTDVPPNVNFTAADSTTSGLFIPSLGPNEKIGLWIKRVVNGGSPPHKGNIAKIAFDFTPSGTPSDPNVPPPVTPSCSVGQHWDYTQQKCVDDSIPPPPPDPDEVNFSIAVVSDVWCNNNFDDIYTHIKSHNPARIFCAGDLLKDGTCIIDTIQDTRDKWIISLGNHDTEGSNENTVREFGRFPPTNYYSTTFNNVGVLVFDFNGDTTSGSQATYMQAELTRLANNPAVEWIFVLTHGPFYSTESDHANEVDMRDFWHPKFDANKVDLMLNGHNHTKEATALVRYNPDDSDNPIPTQTGGTYSYNRGTVNHGMLFFEVGSGGDSMDNLGNMQDWVEFGAEEVGYVLIDFSEEGRKCVIKHMDTNDNLLYAATITHRV